MQNESDELCRLQAPLPFLSVEEFTTEPPPIVEMLCEKEPLFNISSLPTFPSLRTSPISFVLSLACFLFLLFFLVHIFITLRQRLSTLYFRWTTRDRLQSCWFCGHRQKVAWEQLSWWFCQQCEQYNGFNEATGDYNYPIRGMFDPAANRTPISRTPQPVPSIISNSETNMLNATCSPSDILCRTCALNQSCWLAQMSSFQPSSENKLEAEAAAFEASLKDSFRLCSLCSRRVEQELQRKHSLLNQYWFGSKLQQSKSALGDIKKQTTSMRRKTKLASALLFYKNVAMAILVAFFLDTFLANHTNLYISNSLGYGFNYFKHRFLPFLSSSVWESLISYMALSLLPVTLLLCIFLLDERRPQLRAVTPPCLLPSSRLLLFVVIAEFVMFALATVALTDLQSKTIDLSVVAQHGNLLASLLWIWLHRKTIPKEQTVMLERTVAKPVVASSPAARERETTLTQRTTMATEQHEEDEEEFELEPMNVEPYEMDWVTGIRSRMGEGERRERSNSRGWKGELGVEGWFSNIRL